MKELIIVIMLVWIFAIVAYTLWNRYVEPYENEHDEDFE